MWGITDYGSFVLSFIVLLLIPGPGNLALVTSTTQGGVRAGVAAILGVIVGDQVLMWLAVAGVSAILQTHPIIFNSVQWLGAVYLILLGVGLLRAKPGVRPIINIKPRHYMRQCMLITLLNPKAVVFYMAFFPLFIDLDRRPGLDTFMLMAVTVATLTFIYGIFVIFLTSFLAAHLRANKRVTQALQKLAGIFLIGFGLKIAALRIAI
ncbi:LysE family transporter [Pseudomonas fluorescens]